ncbi:Trk system potassium uptake protein TrkA, C-terminal domain / putative permease membrane region multi-domain protein [Prevotella sp. oral taxon 306 str. F0472]|jgi:aspT/yidE/ybjL antiporter duplication domain|uniref:putative transporter n=1 Tax=unclassified Prevotella TaxID=2638335 RepID=UPI00025B9E32|nr:putative transporter [Prevotella sp. oral taxon 306]EID34530.1 Trk system potassium uptake protein TrkA, C-terminal domain / putative permease membrane region multi-domain protein [Prevotella sp. oral taxon 306 str. F0472]
MDWINGLFSIPSALQGVVVISLICAVGLGLGKIKFAGISLGVAFVFFFGIAVGSLGLKVDDQMLNYCETFGLVIFVYTLGLHVGPNFFGSFRHEGTSFNIWSLAVIILGTAMAIALTYIMKVPMSDMIGILCGATTNTPALGAGQQALQHVGVSGARAALATAVTYPLGVVGVIFAMIFIRKFFVKPSDLEVKSSSSDDHTFIGQFVVVNPAINGKNIADIAQGTHRKFIISRIWRGDEVIVPKGTTELKTNDNLLVATKKEEVPAMELLFGKRVERDLNKEQVDWNHLDSKVESRVIVLSKSVLNGKRLGQLHLRDAYNVNVSRVLRSDIKLLATEDLVLRYGDRLTLVGQPEAIDHAEKFLGNSVKTLNEPNLAIIFLGMLLGLALGTIPFTLPGMDSPIHLGIAGGPIIMGILIGAFGPRFHFIAYATRSASLMLRKLGLALYLACLGLDAGKDFLATVVRPEGLLWIGLGFVLTVLPVIIVGVVALRMKKFDFGTICGILCGSMANPMALGYANDTVNGETSNISYATVYPLGMFIRVIIAQVLVMFFV